MSQQLSDFFFVFHDYFRWIWRDPLNDLTGVHACTADVWRWGANALHLRGSQFWPSDGDGDCSLGVAHGQRQPAHLAIDKPSHRPKYGLTSYCHNMTEDAGDSFWLQTWYRTRKLRELWHDGYLTLLASWGIKSKPWLSLMVVSCWCSPLFWGPGFTQWSIGAVSRHSFLLVIGLRWCSLMSPVKRLTARGFFNLHLGHYVCSKL